MIRTKKYITGDYLEIEVYNLSPHAKVMARAAKTKESTPAQKKLNNKKAVRQFVRIINENFGWGDYGVELTFDKDHLPNNKEEVRHELKNYFKRLRNGIKSQGGNPDEFKYVYVISDRDGKDHSKITRLHVHLFMKGIDRDLIEDKWHAGYVNTDKLRCDETGLTGKAKYYSTQGMADDNLEKNKRTWGKSNNVIVPQPVVSDRAMSRYQMDRIINDPSDGAYVEKLFNAGRKTQWIFTDCKVERDGRELFGSDIDTGEGMGNSLFIQMRKETWRHGRK